MDLTVRDGSSGSTCAAQSRRQQPSGAAGWPAGRPEGPPRGIGE